MHALEVLRSRVICVNAAAEPGADEILRLDGFEFTENGADFAASEIREELLLRGSLNRIWLVK